MPYIKQDDRRKFGGIICDIDKLTSEMKAGDLNFLITSIVHRYIESHGLSYGTINEVIGVLECAKLELYRRKAVPYEKLKIEENGDV